VLGCPSQHVAIQPSLIALLRTAECDHERRRESAIRDLWVYIEGAANRRTHASLDPDDLNILATDVTMDLLASVDRDRPEQQVRAFVYRLIDRRLWHARRDRQRRLETSLEEDPPGSPEPLFPGLRELEVLFQRALEPDATHILELRCEGYSHREIAQITHRTPDAIRTSSSRALARICAWVQLDLKEGMAYLAQIIGHESARLMRMLLLEGKDRQDIAETLRLSHAQVNAKIHSAWHQLVMRSRSQPVPD
jgi:DNA-directed RNA polymerase specialized sigma24 family protein